MATRMKNIKGVIGNKMADELIAKTITSDGVFIFIYTGKMAKYIYDMCNRPYSLVGDKLYKKITSSIPQNICNNYNFNDK